MKLIMFLEGAVSEDKWDDLQRAYGRVSAKKTDIAPEASYLAQDSDNPKMWRIVSVWEKGTFKKMLELSESPAIMMIFREAGSSALFSTFDIRSEK